MNFTEAMNVVHNRIQQLEPENASKIIGYLLLMQDHGDRDMIRLAFCPDSVMRSMINFVKCELAKDPRYHHSPPSSDHVPTTRSSFGSFTGSPIQPPSVSVSPPMRTGFWENPTEVVDSLQNNIQFLNFDDSMTSHEFSSGFFPRDHHHHQCLPLRTSRRSPSLPEFPVKICHYFSKGYCKHGGNCRYFHGQIIPERESFSQMFNPNNVSDEEHVVSPGSLEKLEGEIIELLKSRRGAPISIASLPMMYFEKYGRTLQAEGYLTESQRHGKAGFSLTKLLARLKNTIRLIDRPHGQHSVILAEDVSKFVEYMEERNEHGAILAGSKQIYLTFPAESSFTEHDVSNYFSKFGLVEDVRIPCQQKRMFGFVTFVYTETVKLILAKGNPHFICGARVLVKPYREKSRSSRYLDNNKPLHGMRYGSQYMDRDMEMNTLPARVSESSRLMRKQFLEEHEQSVSKSLPTNYSYLGFSDDFKLTADEEQAGRLSYLLEYLNTEDNVLNITTNYKDSDRRIHCEPLDNQVLNLPESPFSSLSGKEISTVT
ncbi:zinc finger CCCH domain-containing protein 18 isoform X2 [Raphanus sativus]|uniref:Zinc finger CCCH domain-containing protein 18 isoform X2 n=1 Tax=Raphanus sativus TaxID=3726 RepID=A0A6J0P5R1_RAPSA|nr:zinc finger CCCH domain-containing protein 18 isoform X2 [Raphanus sativus]